MTDPLGPVIITSREIYDKLVQVVAAVERLNDKLDEHNGDLRDHETRIRALEKGRWPLPSLAALISVAALVLAYFKK